MIEAATARGISSLISTNFSVPFDAERAERLVASGLTILGVSLDGARQETYEQYRVRGDLDTVLRNVRLVNDAKRKLGSATPKLIWSFHVLLKNDGGVAPCCGSFYREDDVGRVSADAGDGGARTFREVWNGPDLRRARGLYTRRDGDEAARRSICFDCPQTVIWERWQHHMGGGGLEQDFDPGFNQNDVFNYFWNRQKLHRPAGDPPRAARGGRR